MPLYVDWPALLKKHRMTVAELSEITGVEYHNLYRMLSGRTESMNMETAGRVLMALGVRVEPPFYLKWEANEPVNLGRKRRYHDGGGPEGTSGPVPS